MAGNPEAFSRVLIDRALQDSGWDLLDPHQVRFELHGQSGRADYVLSGQRGPLCVLEAKREDTDPYEAKEQARGYAENLKAPFVILSNGNEHWFWNYERADQRDAYRIERMPSPEDLERLRLKNLQPPRPLMTEIIGQDYLKPFKPEIALHGYQVKAIDAISRQFDEMGRRRFLLEMATGTGKTLLCAALIRRFLATRNAERVLFIVDRIELAKQTMEDFNVILREYSPVVFKTARRRPMELLGSSVVVATIQSLMTDRRYRTEFTPFHFDLVVNDEAHRSIYGDAREVVHFFQATRVGLTFDCILANPPFAGKIQKESILADINLETRDTELLFLKWFIDHLVPGGRAGVIVPNGVLFGSNKADRKVRELLLTTCDLQAVVNLPSGAFKPYSGVGTAVLIFEKGGPKFKGTQSVWFYDLTADGYSLDDKRTPIEANDIPDVLAKWPERQEGPNSYRVPIEKIKANDFSLAAGRYRQVVVDQTDHKKPADLLGEVLALEKQIASQAEALLKEIGK